MDDSPNLLITCVGENIPKFHFRILALFKTIKKFGGQIANQKLVANFVNSVDKDVESELQNMGVEVRIVQPFDSRSPHCNKIRILEMEDEYDVLIALDCDTVVVRDFYKEIDPNYFQAKPVNNDPLTIDQWKYMFSYFGLELPDQRVITAGVKQSSTIPYFNSGVLAIPKSYVKRLHLAWEKYAKLILDNYHKMGELANRKYFADQHSLSLALVAENIPIKIFPVEMNFSTPIQMKPEFSPRSLKPYIFHYHRFVLKNGLIQKTRYRYSNPDSFIKKVNKFLRYESGLLKNRKYKNVGTNS